MPEQIQRADKIKSLGAEYITMYECQWARIKRQKKIPDLDIFKYHNKKLKPQELLRQIRDGEFFGMVKCKEISIPKEKRQMWLDMNFPPLFTKVELDENELSPFMLAKLKQKGAKFPLGK